MGDPLRDVGQYEPVKHKGPAVALCLGVVACGFDEAPKLSVSDGTDVHKKGMYFYPAGGPFPISRIPDAVVGAHDKFPARDRNHPS